MSCIRQILGCPTLRNWKSCTDRNCQGCIRFAPGMRKLNLYAQQMPRPSKILRNCDTLSSERAQMKQRPNSTKPYTVQILVSQRVNMGP
jgi:hypothetical protein